MHIQACQKNLPDIRGPSGYSKRKLKYSISIYVFKNVAVSSYTCTRDYIYSNFFLFQMATPTFLRDTLIMVAQKLGIK